MKRDNKGSTLITVIVAIAFVTILTSIILGTTVVNLSMKGIDRKVKDDFYYAEKGMGDIYTGIGQKMAAVAGKEYDKTFKEIGKTYSTAGEAEKHFRLQFLQECFKKYNIAGDTARVAELNKYISDPGATLSSNVNSVSVVSANSIKYMMRDGTPTTTEPTIDTITEYSAVVVPDVSVSATDKNGYQSIITTDIVIECPTVDFLDTNAEITDYAIIGCQGVYFSSSDSTNNYAEVSGNIYGGVHDAANSYDELIYPAPTPTPIPLYGGINIIGSKVDVKSNYVVSKGDINITGDGSKLTIGSSDTTAGIPGVWFDTMRTVEGSNAPEIDINANMFALNDLELNADGSQVVLKGDYYGYDDETLYGKSELTSSISLTSDRKDADSSSIIINGKKCSLNMKDVHSLVLLGKAFIDFSSKGEVLSANKIAESAESLALQTNQQLYLVPNDFMETPNPATSENYDSKFKMNKKRWELDTEVNPVGEADPTPEHYGWFGYKYVKVSDGAPNDIVDDFFDEYTVKLSDGEEVHYAYLKFNQKCWQWDPGDNKYVPAIDDEGNEITVPGTKESVSSKTAFFDEIMKATGDPNTTAELQPCAARLREKILRSINKAEHFDLRNLILNNSDSKVIYGQNAIVSYEVTDGTVNPSVKGNTEGMERFAGYPDKLFRRYQLLCVFLDGREDTKLKDPISFDTDEETKISSDWKRAAVTSPMDNYVLVNDIKSKNISSEDERRLPGDTTEAFGACIVAPSYTLSSGSKLRGAAFIDGDVVIESGAEVDGLLMATGTITIKGGSSSKPTKIKANKGLIQARIEKELNLVENGSDYEDNFLISYLTNDGTTRMYSISPGGKKEEYRIKADYNSFMYYENWQKGKRDI